MLTKSQQNDLKRWYPLPKMVEAHYQYYEFRRQGIRFIIVKAGRRSYKTEIAKRILVEEALLIPGNYFIAAPTIPQVRLIYWDDIKAMTFPSSQQATPKEQLLMRPLDNGSRIQLLGMEKPKRFEGPYWTGGILDEMAYYKADAWPLSIRPALDTQIPGMPPPWCIILSKPNGINHFYEMWQYAVTQGDENWRALQWTSEDVLSEEAIAAAKREMSDRQYRQEYLGEFVTATGRIYDDYDENNLTQEEIQPDEEIHYTCDFNATPMSHCMAVIRGNDVLILDEIILKSAKGYYNAQEFCDRYKDHKNKVLYLYGDRSGRNGEKHGFETEYLLMEEVFEKSGWEVHRDVQDANPAIKDRHNNVNAKVKNAEGERSLFVNPIKCPYVHRGFMTGVFKEGSAYHEEEDEYQHIMTAVGYFISRKFPITQDIGFIKDIEFNMFGSI